MLLIQVTQAHHKKQDATCSQSDRLAKFDKIKSGQRQRFITFISIFSPYSVHFPLCHPSSVSSQSHLYLPLRFLGTKSSPWLASSSSWLTGLWALPCLLQATPSLPKSPTVSPLAENHFMYFLCLAIIRVWNPAVNYDIRSAKGEPITTFIHCITA